MKINGLFFALLVAGIAAPVTSAALAAEYPGWHKSYVGTGGEQVYCPDGVSANPCRTESDLRNLYSEGAAGATPTATASAAPAPMQSRYCMTFDLGGSGWRYVSQDGNACGCGYTPFFPSPGFSFFYWSGGRRHWHPGW
jgi:hypothetical protein